MGIETILLASAVALAAAGTATSIASSASQSSQAKKAASAQADQQKKLADQMAQRQTGAESEANAIATRDAAKQRQANLAIGAGGRPDTILTGPLGVTGEAPGTKKTLLGT